MSIAPITTPAALAACEEIIERGLRSFVEVGEALTRIRDERLYRGSHETFEDYCRARWDLSRPRAYQLIAAAETTVLVSTNVDTPTPASEAVTRELGRLREEPEALREAWTEAVQQHGPTPTAAQVREVVTHVRQNGSDSAPTKSEPAYTQCPCCGQRVRADQPLRRPRGATT